MKDLLLRFSQALLLQTERTAVEASQSIEQRLCMFFLMILDRLSDNSMAMTHEFLGHMLGEDRVSERYAMLKKEYERLLPHALCYEAGSVGLADLSTN